jgi:hypothetical protein
VRGNDQDVCLLTSFFKHPQRILLHGHSLDDKFRKFATLGTRSFYV